MNTQKAPTIMLSPRPILKWAGGKQQLVNILSERMPSRYGKYIEPFFGGGALYFSQLPEQAVIADVNPELVNLYRCVANDVEAVIERLWDFKNDEEIFYQVRSIDADKLNEFERAARTIYLNKTCFNGLYRVNRNGQFNVPFGRYKKPNICDEDNLRAASVLLKNATILQGDYKQVLKTYAEKGDFVFLDPPYLPVSKYADFKRYTKEQFYEDDQMELAEEVQRLQELGCYVILTNSNHPLVHKLYSKFKVEVFNTKRYINKDATKRQGEDVVVTIEPKRVLNLLAEPIRNIEQVRKYPSTRYMGSKQKLLDKIWAVASQFEFNSVLDLFCGSGVVSYMFKAQGKQVFTNDYMHFSSCLSRALIQNNTTTLSRKDIAVLCDRNTATDNFVSNTFKDLYFSNEDNDFIDIVRANIVRLKGSAKQDIAMSALIRACLKKRPRGIFTYTGLRYDDGRKDLKLTIEEQFFDAIEQINRAVFDNKMINSSRLGDAMESRQHADVVYIDPPYYSPLSDNEYVRRYHFLEGLARNWQGVEIQEHTKTKKFKSYPTPFSSYQTAYDAFDVLFRHHRNSILIVSYSSNSLPTQEQMLELLSKYKSQVEVISVNHTYSVGNQGNKVNDNKNRVQEYLFVGY